MSITTVVIDGKLLIAPKKLMVILSMYYAIQGPSNSNSNFG
jgi:hypothetical protein